MKLFKFKKFCTSFCVLLVLSQLNFVCNAITPQDVIKTSENVLQDLAPQLGEKGLKIYCPMGENDVNFDVEKLYKVVSKFLDDCRDVDASKFDDYCKDYIVNHCENKNFDGKIKVVGADEFKKYVDNPDYVQLFRGVSGENSTDLRSGGIRKNVRGAVRGAFYSGDNGSTSGNGMYFTSEYRHAKYWGDYEKGEVVTGVVKKDSLRCISSDYLRMLFRLMLERHKNDRKDFKIFLENEKKAPIGKEYQFFSSAFKSYTERLKNKTGFDYFSDENMKKSRRELSKNMDEATSKLYKQANEEVLSVLEDLFGKSEMQTIVDELKKPECQTPEFKEKISKFNEQCAEKIREKRLESVKFYEENKESYLIDKIYFLTRNAGLLAKIFGFDAVCDSPSQTTRGEVNKNVPLSDESSVGMLTQALAKEDSSYYDYVADEVVFVNFDNLVVCSDKFEPKKKL